MTVLALSPAQAMLGELLAFVRQGDVQAVHSLRRGVAEALEIVVRGDRKSSRVVGRKVGDLQLPHDVHMGLIVRGLPDSRVMLDFKDVGFIPSSGQLELATRGKGAEQKGGAEDGDYEFSHGLGLLRIRRAHR